MLTHLWFDRVVMLLVGISALGLGGGCRQLETRRTRDVDQKKNTDPELPPSPLPESSQESRQAIPPTPAAEAWFRRTDRRDSGMVPAGYNDAEPIELPAPILNSRPKETPVVPRESGPAPVSIPDGPVAAVGNSGSRASLVEIDGLQFVAELNRSVADTSSRLRRDTSIVPVRVVSRSNHIEDWPHQGLPQGVVVCPMTR